MKTRKRVLLTKKHMTMKHWGGGDGPSQALMEEQFQAADPFPRFFFNTLLLNANILELRETTVDNYEPPAPPGMWQISYDIFCDENDIRNVLEKLNEELDE